MSHNTQPETPECKGKQVYLEAGADYVISNLAELRELINMINSGLEITKTQPCTKTPDYVIHSSFLQPGL